MCTRTKLQCLLLQKVLKQILPRSPRAIVSPVLMVELVSRETIQGETKTLAGACQNHEKSFFYSYIHCYFQL